MFTLNTKKYSIESEIPFEITKNKLFKYSIIRFDRKNYIIVPNNPRKNFVRIEVDRSVAISQLLATMHHPLLKNSINPEHHKVSIIEGTGLRIYGDNNFIYGLWKRSSANAYKKAIVFADGTSQITLFDHCIGIAIGQSYAQFKDFSKGEIRGNANAVVAGDRKSVV